METSQIELMSSLIKEEHVKEAIPDSESDFIAADDVVKTESSYESEYTTSAMASLPFTFGLEVKDEWEALINDLKEDIYINDTIEANGEIKAEFPCILAPPPSLRANGKLRHYSKHEYVCDTCNMSFAKRCSLIRHLPTHDEDRPFMCNICNKSYVKSFHLKQHMRGHTGERPYCCDLCGKSYCRRDYLILHLRTHTGERPFTCKICRKSFIQGGHLKEHLRTHNSNRPFHCKLCKKSFCRLRHLKQHLGVHARKKYFVCEACKRSFTRHVDLRRHARTHEEKHYKENAIGENLIPVVKAKKTLPTYAGPSNLTFDCATCLESFPQLGDLKSHLRTHLGNIPNMCQICKKSFSRSSALKCHLLLNLCLDTQTAF